MASEEINLYLVQSFKKLGKKQSEVINDLQKPQSYVSALMSGKKKVGKVIALQLSELYGFDPAKILTGWMNKVDIPKKDIKKEKSFNELSLDEKLNFLYNQNIDLKEEYENIKNEIGDLSLLIEISLAPILRHFHLKKDENKENTKNSSVN